MIAQEGKYGKSSNRIAHPGPCGTTCRRFAQFDGPAPGLVSLGALRSPLQYVSSHHHGRLGRADTVRPRSALPELELVARYVFLRWASRVGKRLKVANVRF